MTEAFMTIIKGGTGEVVIKKSRFIATVCPVSTEDEAILYIDELKKKFWDASHNCFAYIIGTENPILRCSDDGEPSKTAGRPMLDVLLHQDLTNLVIVVTRYFGGTLLGTGGLVKAYQSATLEGLNKSIIIKKELGNKILISTDYNMIRKIQYYLNQANITILSSEYTEIVLLTVLVPPTQQDFFTKKIAELTNNSATLTINGYVYFTNRNGEVILF